VITGVPSGFTENESVIPKSFFNIIIYIIHMFQLRSHFFKVLPYGLSQDKDKDKESFRACLNWSCLLYLLI